MRQILKSLALMLFVVMSVGKAQADEFVIGFAGAQTGGLAPFDAPFLEGAELAVHNINEAGGIAGKLPIKMLVRDSQSNAAQTAIIVEELINEGAHVIILPADAEPSFAAAPILNERMIPGFSSAASAPTLATVGGEYVFINFPADNVQATVAAEYAAEQGYKSAYLLVSPDTQYTMMPMYFGEAFEANGGTVIGRSDFHIEQQDFSAEVTKIKALNPQPDVIYTSAYEPDFPSFLRQLRQAGLDTPVIGADGIDSPTTFSLGDIGEGVVFTTAGHPLPGSAMETFTQDFEKFHGKASDTVYQAVGYDLIKVFEAGVIANDMNLEGSSLRDALNNVEGVQGATAIISYKGTQGIPIREGYLIRVTNGEREYLGASLPDVSTVPEAKMY